MGYLGYESQIYKDVRTLARATNTPEELMPKPEQTSGVAMHRSATDEVPMHRLLQAQANVMTHKINALSRWVDDNNGTSGSERLWGRTAKVGEEIGEVAAAGLPADGVALLTLLNGRLVEAVIGVTGQNPRKGVTHTGNMIDKELLDIAVTALAAVESRQGNNGTAIGMLGLHLDALVRRAQIDFRSENT